MYGNFIFFDCSYNFWACYYSTWGDNIRMKIWIDENLKQEDIKSFLKISLQKIITFADNHAVSIEDVGAYVKKDNYVLCFGAHRRGELELFVVPARGVINGKEDFEKLVSTSSPSPIEYEWKDIEEIELPPPPQSPFQENFPFNITFEEEVPNG